MNQKILLSMLTAGVVPAVAYADATAVELASKDVLTSTNGEKIVTDPITLVPGTYTVAASENEKAVLVMLSDDGGKTCKNKLEIKEATEVCVVAMLPEGADKEAFTVGGITITLNFDFAAARNKLNNALAPANSAANEASKIEEKTQTTAKELYDLIEGKTLEIAEINDYASYVKYELWKAENELTQQIATFNKQAINILKNAKLLQKVSAATKELNSNLKAVWANAVKDSYAAATYKAQKDNISKAISAYQKAAEKAASTYEVEMEGYPNEETEKQIQDDITKLAEDIVTANADEAAYKLYQEEITAATAAYSKALSELQKLMSADVYANMFAEAQTKLNEQNQKVRDLNAAIKDKKGAAAVRAEKETEVTEAAAKMVEIQKDYTARVNTLNGIYQTKVEAIEAVENELALDEVAAKFEENVKKAAADLDALKKKVQAYDALGLKEYTKAEGAFEKELDEIQKYIDEFLPDLKANLKAYTLTSQSIQALQDKLDNAKETADGHTFGTEVDEEGNEVEITYKDKYAAAEKKIQDNIDALVQAAKAAYDEGESVDFELDEETMKAINDAVEQYITDTEAAYQGYLAGVSAIAGYTQALAELTEQVGENGEVTVRELENYLGKTYSEAIAGLTGSIDALQTALDEAVAMEGDARVKALSEFDVKESIGTDLTALKAAFDADKIAYDNRVMDIANNLKASVELLIQNAEDILSYKLDKTGKATAELDAERTGIRKEIAEQKAKCDAVVVSADEADAAITTLAAIRSAFTKEETGLNAKANAWKKKVEQAEDHKKANDAEYEKFLPAKEAIVALVQVEIDKVVTTDDRRTEEFATLKGELQDKLTAITDKVNAANAAEILNDNVEVEEEAAEQEAKTYSETYQAELDALKAEAIDAVAAAKAADENRSAYDSLRKSDLSGSNTTLSTIATAITTARKNLAKSTKVEPEGKKYYEELLNTYEDTDLPAIILAIETDYNERVSAANKDERKSEMANLLTAVKKVVANAETNQKKYDAQVEKAEKVQEELTALINRITLEDESSKLNEWLTQLTELQDALNVLRDENNAGTIEDKYLIGESDASDKEIMDELTRIDNERAAIGSSQETGYKALILEDNNHAWLEFADVLAVTKKTYAEKVAFISQFAGTKALENVLDTNKAIYEYAAMIQELQKNAETAKKEADEAEPRPAVFVNLKYIADAEAYTVVIIELYNGFVEEVNVAALTDYKAASEAAEKKFNATKNGLKTYDADVQKKALEDAASLYDEVMGKENNPRLALDLDNYLELFDALDKALDLVPASAAELQWTKNYNELNNTISEAYDLIYGYTFGSTANNFVATYDNLKAQLADLAERMADAKEEGILVDNIKSLLANLKSISDAMKENHEKAYDAAGNSPENQAQCVVYNDEIDSLAEQLKALREFTNPLYVIYDYTRDFNSMEEDLAGLKGQVKGYSENGGAISAKEDMEKKFGALADQIAKGYDAVLTSEYGALTRQVQVVKSAYNEYIGENVYDEVYMPRVNKFESDVLAYATILYELTATVDSEGEEKTPDYEAAKAGLLNLEAQLAALLTDIANATTEGASADMADQLIKQIEAVEATLASYQTDLGENCHKPVQELYAGQLTEIAEQLAALKARVATDKVVLYREPIAKAAETLKENMEAVKADIDALELIYDTNDEVYAEVSAKIQAVRDHLADYVQTVATYKYPVDTEWNVNMINSYLDGITDEDGVVVSEGYVTDLEKRFGAIKLDKAAAEEFAGKLEGLEGMIINYRRSAAYWNANYTYANDLYDYYYYGNDEIEGIQKQVNALKKNNWFGSLAEIDVKAEAIEEILKNSYINIYNNSAYRLGNVSADIYGNPILDEEGNPTTLAVDYLAEGYDVVMNRIAEVREMMADLLKTAQEGTYVEGDADLDGEVTVLDYDLVLGYILKLDELPDYQSKDFAAADVNGNSSVEVGDLQLVIEKIRNKINHRAAARLARAEMLSVEGNNEVSVEAREGNGSTRVFINLNANAAYAGAQLDIVLPEGAEVKAVAAGQLAQNLNVSSNSFDGIHRVVISSLDGAAIQQGAGSLIELEIAGANGNISVANMMLTDNYGNLYEVSGAQGAATGINGVQAEGSLMQKVYSVSGKVLNGLRKGINIVVGSDGTARKVMEK